MAEEIVFQMSDKDCAELIGDFNNEYTHSDEETFFIGRLRYYGFRNQEIAKILSALHQSCNYCFGDKPCFCKYDEFGKN